MADCNFKNLKLNYLERKRIHNRFFLCYTIDSGLVVDVMNHDEDFLENANSNELDAQEEVSESSENVEKESSSEVTSYPEEMNEPAPVQGSGFQGLQWTTLKKVVSKKYFVPVLIVIGIFCFLFLMFFFMYGGLSGGYSYIAPKCQQMRITFGAEEDASQTTISIEEYIISHIYSATKNLSNIDPDLYRTLAIAINTEVQSSNNCSRTYIPEVDDIYQFEILGNDSDTFYQIQKDIKPVKDLVMVKRNSEEYFETTLDGFCSFSEMMAKPEGFEEENLAGPSNATSTSYTIPQITEEIPYHWVEDNVDNWNFKNCPCNDSSNANSACFLEEWNYGEDEEPDLIYVDGGTGTGISIYATHYLTSQDNRTYEGVLKLFYPNKDWELKTNDPTMAKKKFFDSQECTGGNVPFRSTPLSRSEFISLVTTFLSNGKYASYAQLFIDHAGDIYDMGVEKNINPELIYIFARKETAFTSVSSDTQHYNYYGMGHCNTCSHGKFYDSFMEGVEYLFDYFVEKGSLDAVVKVYSYLGDWLYNFDDRQEMGLGGCYYLKINFGENYSRCSDSYYCAPIRDASGKVIGRTPGCVQTTQEERDSYIAWQAEKYIQHRQAIFNLGKEVCQTVDGIFGDTNGTSFLNKPISSFLISEGTTLDAFNEAIIRDGCNYRGTGAGVAYVASRAVMQLAEYGKKFHYVYGGMHQENPPSSYGVLPNWGPYGPDCSSFVTWAVYNAGFTWFNYTASQWGTKATRVELGDSRLQIGDAILTPGDTRPWGHIVIITNINNAEGYYNVVHASSTATGVIFGKVSFNERSRKGLLLSEFYNKHQVSDSFDSMCASKGY